MKTEEDFTLKKIGEVRCPLKEKFGLPRQSGLSKHLEGEILLDFPYGCEEALRGIEQFSHLWVLWGFSEVPERSFAATVRPPKLGGNQHIGVFATRSPFRPNPIGLTVVRLLSVEQTENGSVLHISGLDMQNGTPVYDIKPYIPYADSVPDAVGGFAEKHQDDKLEVVFPPEFAATLQKKEFVTVCELLALDPRPAYQADASRVYGLIFGKYQIRFTVKDKVLTVCQVEKTK